MVDTSEEPRDDGSSEQELLRRRMAALEDEVRLLQEAQQVGGMGSYCRDLETGRIRWSAETYRIFGYSPGEIELCLTRVETHVHPEDRERFREANRRAIEDGGPYLAEYRIRRADGLERTIRSRGRTERSADGRAVRLWGAVQDITDQRRMEAANRESHERFRNAFEHSAVGMALVAVDGRFLLVNRAACEILGYSPRELLSLRFQDVTHPDDLERSKSELTSVLAGETTHYTIEKRYVRSDGRVIRGVLTVSLVRTAAEEPRYLVAQLQDETRRWEAEEALRKSQERALHAQKLESLGVLAGGIAHDFNNLLVAILGNAELAQLDLDPEHPARSAVERLVSAAKRAADLTGQMLAYSGQGRFVVRPVDLGSLVKEMAHLLRASVSRRVALRLDVDGELPRVRGDAAQLQQVVMNLITNASDALADETGVVTVRISTLDAARARREEETPEDVDALPPMTDGEPPERYVCLEVADTGCGMSAETTARIFEPFFTTKFAGRGLGLAAVLGIVRGHDGAIRVRSEVGKGTVFRVLLPATSRAGRSEKTETKGSEEALGPRASAETVLVIDDEPGVRETTRASLEKRGYHVLTAADGARAVELFRERSAEVSAILLDLTMPGLSGEETLLALRRISPDARIVLTSGYSAEDATSRLADQGLAGFLQKPFSIEDLVRVLGAGAGS